MMKQEYYKSELTDGHRKKLCLLLKFKEHMDTKLAPPAENMPESINTTDRWIYLSRYIITKRAAIFRFTNGVVQVIYNDKKRYKNKYFDQLIIAILDQIVQFLQSYQVDPSSLCHTACVHRRRSTAKRI